MRKNRKIKEILTKKFLQKEYVKNKKSIPQIAKVINSNFSIVFYYLKKFNIKRRTRKELSIGKNNANYKDGRTLKKYYCIEGCGKEINYNSALYGNRRCYSCANKEKYRIGILNNKGKNHPNWKNGIGNLPYPFEFNDKLREKVRKRDNYQCQNCNMTEEEHLIVCGVNLSVHHIDYNKKNCKEDNLIALCIQCNTRANYNRAYWKKHYNELMNVKVLGSSVKGK